MKPVCFRRLTLLAVLVLMLSALMLNAAASDAPAIGIAVVDTHNGLYLRSEPSTSDEIIAVASYEDALVVLDSTGDWYHVLYNLEEGYVHKDYVIFKERENVELGDGMIIETLVNVRSGPGTDNSKVASMNKDETARIIGFNCGWYKVIYNGVTGYVRSDLMDLTEKPLTNTDGFGFGGVIASDGDVQSAVSVTDVNWATPQSNEGSSTATALCDYAQTLVGCPYVFGGTSPSGFDCSGFVQYVYKQFGYTLNRTANDQQKNGTAVAADSLQPGDIVFFGSGSYSNHSGIYIGDGKFVHAANSYTGVVVANLYSDYYNNAYIGARRILN